MASSPDTYARLSDNEYYAYRGRLYYEMVDGDYRVNFSDEVFRCPYCFRKNRRDYSYNELLQHAFAHRDSRNNRDKEKATHSALVKYMEKYIDKEREPPQSPKPNVSPSESSVRDETLEERCSVSESPSEPTLIDRPPKETESEERFVWPWVTVLANVSREFENWSYVGASGSKGREALAREGFNPLKVQPLWNHNGHSGFSIVDFAKELSGFSLLMIFEKSFEAKSCGKRDYRAVRSLENKKLYGWAARAEDFLRGDIVGFNLKKKRDLKTVNEIQAEDDRKHTTLVTDLANNLKYKKFCLEEIEIKYKETPQSSTAVEQQTSEMVKAYNKVEQQTSEMVKAYNKDVAKMQQTQRDQFERIFKAGESKRKQLEAERIKLDNREKQLHKLDSRNESETKKLYELKTMNERATLEQTKVNEDVLKLVKEQERENEKLHLQILALQKKLDAKKQLELEIECLKGALQVMKHMAVDEDSVVCTKKMEEIANELIDKEADNKT